MSEANGALDVGYTQRCIDEAQRGPRNSKPTDKVAAAAAAKVARKPFTDITKNAAAAANDDDRAAELKARAGSAWGGLKSWGSGLADKVKDLRVDNDGGDLGNFLASNRSTLGSGKEMAGLGSTGFGSDALSRPAHARHDSSNFGSDGFMTADDGVLRPVLLPELIFQRVANVLGQRIRRVLGARVRDDRLLKARAGSERCLRCPVGHDGLPTGIPLARTRQQQRLRARAKPRLRQHTA